MSKGLTEEQLRERLARVNWLLIHIDPWTVFPCTVEGWLEEKRALLAELAKVSPC